MRSDFDDCHNGQFLLLFSQQRITFHPNVITSKSGKGPSRTAGRPTKFNPQVVERLCAALADGMPIKGACVVAGIGVTTLAEWREKHSRLEDRMSEARELARQNALQTIKAAGEKDWRAKAEWLRLAFAEDYRGGQKVEVQQAVQVRISSEQLADLRSRLEDTRAWLRSRDTSGAGGTRKNEEEIDVEPSRQKLSDSDDAALYPPQPVPLDWAGQPMQAGGAYNGRPVTAKDSVSVG